MLQYIVIQLDDTSTSFCHYPNQKNGRHLMPLETLRKGIVFGLKENLGIQIIYPSFKLPDEYERLIEDFDCVRIKPATASGSADVIVFNNLSNADGFEFKTDCDYVLRIDKDTLFNEYVSVAAILDKVRRLNIVITDIEAFSKSDFGQYEYVLGRLCEHIQEANAQGRMPQCNVLTDRIVLDGMNNCGAGETTVTLAPDGRFYVCPGFYLGDGLWSIGNIDEGVDIRNPQLFRLDHAPICRNCDAFQCHRCIWLNKKTTLEVNTPSHEQCVVAHLERNESRKLKKALTEYTGLFSSNKEIEEISYLDPFENRKQWKENQ